MVFARSDWLLKLGTYSPIHLGEASKSRRLRAKGFPGLLLEQTKKRFPKYTRKATKFGLEVFTSKASSNLNLLSLHGTVYIPTHPPLVTSTAVKNCYVPVPDPSQLVNATLRASTILHIMYRK